jgi:hypothetical protein
MGYGCFTRRHEVTKKISAHCFPSKQTAVAGHLTGHYRAQEWRFVPGSENQNLKI